MQIREARIFNFGKLQNVNIKFHDGINVIYGENEQGKSTLHSFLLGMLFGMEKGRGRAGATDAYSRYEPWHAPSFYSGALRFLIGKQSFYLERNFYSKEKSEYLRNELDGEELSVAYGDLKMLLGGIGREEFGNTYNIPQTGAATGKEMAEILTSYLAEAAAGSDGNVRVLEALKLLQAQRKELVARQKQLEEARKNVLSGYQVQKGLYEENISRLREQIDGFEQTQKVLLKEKNEREIQKRKYAKWCATGAILIGILTAGLMFLGMTGILETYVKEGVLISGVVFLAVCILLGLLKRKDKDEALMHAADMLTQMKERLQEMENEAINLTEEMETQSQPSEEEQQLAKDVAALELARTKLGEVSEEYYQEVSDELNAEISKWISVLTNGTYDSARMSTDGRLFVLAQNREVMPEALSRGTLEQIYLALRLAVGSILTREEEMPIFLDEAFAMYDDARLLRTLKALAGTGKQIFIFSCQKREMVILEQEGIPYHRINL